MFLKPPLSIAPTSGFVAFDGGGVDEDAHRFTAKSAVLVPQPEREAAHGPDVDAATDLLQSSIWQPASGLRARRVEGAVIVAICGYFLFGCASLLRWI